MFKYIFLIFGFFFVYAVNAQTNYCTLPCGKTVNTACERQPLLCGPGPKCGVNVQVIKFSNQKKRHYVNYHNIIRDYVATGKESGQPTASNMNALTYNKDLEYLAQCWTNNCEFEHDKCRRTQKYSYAGQNLALLKTTASKTSINVTKLVENMITDWHNEVKYYTPTPTFTSGSQNGHVVGHYTQLVWAETRQVGCAMTYYKDGKWNVFFLACNYGPGGNFLGEPVYKIGPPVSKCASGKRHVGFAGLCQA